MRKLIENQNSTNRKLNSTNRKLSIVGEIVPIVCDLATQRCNLWTPSKLTQTRDDEHRAKMMALLGYKKKAKCMVTGIEGNGDQVICAHLVPLKSNLQILKQELAISAEDLNDSKNCAFWCKSLEDAYETLKVSYVKSPLDQTLRLKIWDDSIKSTPIYEGSTHKIGEYEGEALKLGTHIIMKRTLSYQAFNAYLVWNPLDEELKKSCSYESPGVYNFSKRMQLMRTEYFKDVDDETDDIEGGSRDGGEEVDDIEEGSRDGGEEVDDMEEGSRDGGEEVDDMDEGSSDVDA